MSKKRRGTQSNSKPGMKPHVACVSEEAAKVNIQLKLNLLKEAILNAQSTGGLGTLKDYPKSRTKFNDWAPNRAALEPLKSNANATLKRYPDLLQSVDAAVDLVRQLMSSETPIAVPDRQARIEAARRSQRIHSTLRTIAERAVVEVRREISALRNEITVLKAAKESSHYEYERVREQMRAEIDFLRSENASLLKQLRSFIPLGRHK